ncbi:MAG: hypothetical protein KDE31_37105, partial [Caldilineaceae bacterium]|nr:hypothetical protein [Caldilineaceae bacterium]
GSTWLSKCNAEIEETWLHHLQRMFPDFDRASIREFRIHRERFVEPLHGLNETDKIPALATPIQGLHLVTTAQIYPALTNGESVSRHAEMAAQQIVRLYESTQGLTLPADKSMRAEPATLPL